MFPTYPMKSFLLFALFRHQYTVVAYFCWYLFFVFVLLICFLFYWYIINMNITVKFRIVFNYWQAYWCILTYVWSIATMSVTLTLSCVVVTTHYKYILVWANRICHSNSSLSLSPESVSPKIYSPNVLSKPKKPRS